MTIRGFFTSPHSFFCLFLLIFIFLTVSSVHAEELTINKQRLSYEAAEPGYEELEFYMQEMASAVLEQEAADVCVFPSCSPETMQMSLDGVCDWLISNICQNEAVQDSYCSTLPWWQRGPCDWGGFESRCTDGVNNACGSLGNLF